MSSKGRRRRPQPAPRPQRWWTAEDAEQVRQRLARWLLTRDGLAATYVHYYTVYRGTFPDDLDPWQLARDTATETAERLTELDLIWCDPSMVDLLSAAADAYPPEPWRPELLIGPDGIVIFSKPLPAIWGELETDAPETANISAVTWASGMSDDGRPLLSVVGWLRATGPQTYDVVGRIKFADLRIHSSAVGLYGTPLADQGGPANAARILMALTGLLRGPLVREDTTRPPSIGGRSLRRDTPTIRRVYLRRPEHAQAELDAARDARSGRTHRGHWVRGHWKRQWYPSVEEHRMRGIEGYPRGDFTEGTVPGTKVLIGRADPSESPDAT